MGTPSHASDATTRSSAHYCDGSGNPVPVTTTTPLPTVQGAPASSNILNGYASSTATTAATTLISVPAGRTWKGKIGASCAVSTAAASTVAGQALAVFSVAGSGAVPAGNVFGVEALCGANAAAGTVGSQNSNFGDADLVVAATGAGAVTVQVTTTQAGTSRVDAFATGRLV